MILAAKILAFEPLLSLQIRQDPKLQNCISDITSAGELSEMSRISEQELTPRCSFCFFRFFVSPPGCHVFLPGGAELLFPPGCLSATRRIEWEEKRPEKKLVHLEEHEILLSCPLELQPHGIKFLKVFTEAFRNRLKNNLSAVFVTYHVV